MPQAAQTLTTAELDEGIRTLLAETGGARAASAIHEALPSARRPARDKVTERLRALAQAGSVHVWPGGRSPQYAARPYAAYLRERVPALLAERPLTTAELLSHFPTAAGDQVRAQLRELLREGRIHKHPRLGRRDPYAVHPPDPLDYLRAPLARLVKEYARRGFSEAGLHDALRRFTGAPPAAPSAATDGERILAVLDELDPQFRHGALVYLPHLRQALQAELDQPGRFERALLGLLARGVVQLQSHPVPSQLTEAERAAMLPDGRGSFYMAVGLRR